MVYMYVKYKINLNSIKTIWSIKMYLIQKLKTSLDIYIVLLLTCFFLSLGRGCKTITLNPFHKNEKQVYGLSKRLFWPQRIYFMRWMEDEDSHTLINKLHRCQLNIKKLDETPVHEDEITHQKSQGDPWCDKIS